MSGREGGQAYETERARLANLIYDIRVCWVCVEAYTPSKPRLHVCVRDNFVMQYECVRGVTDMRPRWRQTINRAPVSPPVGNI
jgi:hypothetical protein